MKPLKSTKTLKFDLPADHEVFLEITISSTAECVTRVRKIPKVPSFFYENRVMIGFYNELKGKTIEVEHQFSFAGIPKPNIDDAMKQTKITYNLVSITDWQPLRNNTVTDLNSDFTIQRTRLIAIK